MLGGHNDDSYLPARGYQRRRINSRPAFTMAATIVSEEHRRLYREEGFTVLSGVWSDDQLEAMIAHAQRIPDEPGAFHTYEKVGTGEVVPSRTEGFIWSGDEAGMAAFQGNDSPLAAAVSALVGEGPVRIYKEKLNYKLAGGGGYKAHQDGYTGLGVDREPSVPRHPNPTPAPPPSRKLALNAAAAAVQVRLHDAGLHDRAGRFHAGERLPGGGAR